MKTVRGDDALKLLEEISQIVTDENCLQWRRVCCVNPSIACDECPVGKKMCHQFYEHSTRMRLRRG